MVLEYRIFADLGEGICRLNEKIEIYCLFFLDILSEVAGEINRMVCCEGWTGILMKNSSNGEMDSFYAIRPECQADVPKIRFKPRVPISAILFS